MKRIFYIADNNNFGRPIINKFFTSYDEAQKFVDNYLTKIFNEFEVSVEEVQLYDSADECFADIEEAANECQAIRRKRVRL